jgi:putative nucleotidyltransferase with HDIG domain
MMEELRTSEPSIQKVGQIISKDPGMTAKILQLANSAFFGLSRTLSNTIEATSYLGINHIQNLFLAYHAFSQFTPPARLGFSMDMFWEHSLSTAALAKDIALKEGAAQNVINDAFTAGLLHDIGKLMLACRLPDRYVMSLQEASMKDIPLWAAERRLFSVTHAEIGAYLLGLWGLPDSIIESVAYHHSPALCPNQTFCALTALHAADCWNGIRCLEGIPFSPAQVDYLSRILQNTES